MTVFTILSILPDVDILAFGFGIPYAAQFGHRGATHSLAFALILGVFGAWLIRGRLGGNFVRTALFCVLTIASHPVLDAMTDGGLGVAFAWPFSNARYFAPIRFIPVAPIGTRLLSIRGLHVVLVELLYFAPLFAYALWPRSIDPAPPSSA